MARNHKQLITLSNKSYATGLFWQPLTDKKNPIIEIEKMSDSLIPPANFYCIKNFGSSQYGLGFKDLGHGTKHYVASLVLASLFKDKSSILSCLHTPQGYWVCAIRNSLILPEDDVLYETEEEAKTHFLRLLQLPDWSYKIAPSLWKIETSSSTLIDDLFAIESLTKLTPIKKTSYTRTIIFILLGLFALSFFFQNTLLNLIIPSAPRKSVDSKMLEKYRPTKLDGTDSQSQTSTSKTQSSLSSKKIIEPDTSFINEQPLPTYPWQQLDSVIEFATICNNAVAFYSKPIFGWTLKTVNCSKNNIKIEFTRTSGDISIIMKAYDEYFKPEFENSTISIDDSGNNATTTIPQAVFTKVSASPIEPASIIQKRFTALTQRTKIDINTEIKQDSVEINGISQNFSFIAFTFTSKLGIIQWADLLSTLESTEFINITWDNTTQNWKVEGLVYEKN